jgi:uncharacterized membrane protein (DUF2068 family)
MKEGPRAVGLRLIIVYKLVKAVAQGALAVTLPLLRHWGVTARLAVWTKRLAEHVVHGWTAQLAKIVASLLTPRHLTLISLALGFDAALSAFEGWALHERYRWAPWVVVLAAGMLIPFEVEELVRKFRVGRVVILLANLAIIAYLLVRAKRGRSHAMD